MVLDGREAFGPLPLLKPLQ